MTNEKTYKTAEERHSAFCKWCDNHIHGCSDCILSGESSKTYMCSFKWLELEAADKSISSCPFCGGHCECHEEWNGKFRVVCTEPDCWYSASLKDSESDAIDVHNQLADGAVKSTIDGIEMQKLDTILKVTKL